jgi:ribosome recycling factor
MAAVEKAILAADLGLNPSSDGHVIRVKVPKLSEERRRELTKVIKARGEETKVALRNIRREANDKLDQMKSDGEISEDDHRRYRDKNDEIIQEYSKKVDELVEEKNKQIQTI